MLSRQQIGQMVRAGSYAQLVRRILANGRCGDPVVAQLLTQQHVAELAGLGLALQRWSELDGCSFGLAAAQRSAAGEAGNLIERMVRRLSEVAAIVMRATRAERPDTDERPGVEEEAPEGSLSGGCADLTPGQIAALACACRGLIDHATHMGRLARASSCGLGTAAPCSAERATDKARQTADWIIDSFGAMQQPDGSIGSTLASAIVLWQLGGDEKFRTSIRMDDLCLAVRRTTVRTQPMKAARQATTTHDGWHNTLPATMQTHRGEPDTRDRVMRGRDRRAIPIDEGLRRQALAWSA